MASSVTSTETQKQPLGRVAGTTARAHAHRRQQRACDVVLCVAGALALWLGASAASGCQRAKTPTPGAFAPPVSGTFGVEGLSAPVQIVRDRWGVPHITAANADDLFFAQGFVQAQDRLFEMDLWRRSVQGRLAEVLGSNFIGRDAMTRRIQYRRSADEDWAGLDIETRAIATAFVRGVNAQVALARSYPSEAFTLAGWLPDLWKPQDLLNRTDAFLASVGARDEILRARLVTALGPSRASGLIGSSAGSPADVDLSVVTFQVADALRQIGAPPFFVGLAAPVMGPPTSGARGGAIGSNAWAIHGRRTATGSPILATDPHRPLTNPSSRYLVHLTAPGWNVAGATAPWLPGVVMGHNDMVAWGMTSFEVDTEDLYVEHLNPENPHQVNDGGHWRNTTVVMAPIWVKGRAPATYLREYTSHGVVIAVDSERHLAFTLRWSGLEAGAASELGALALDRATSAADVRAALRAWKMPVVDVVFADRAGTVGSQVAGLVPIRRDGDGRLPTSGGSGAVHWDGWRVPDDLPHALDPAAGYVASANGNQARLARVREALTAPQPLTVDDSRRLQQDVLAWNAERLVPLFTTLRSPRADVERARQQLLDWDRRVSVDSAAAAIYVTWEQQARRTLVQRRVPPDLVEELVTRSSNLFVPALTTPSRVWFDGDVLRARDALMLGALTSAIDDLNGRAGIQDRLPVWGALHATTFEHPLAVNDAARRRFIVGPFARPGYADTILSTSGPGFDASVGASFSGVFDVADWDRAIVQNAPGQAESPASAHVADLAAGWAAGRYFPLPFSDAAVRANAESTLMLVPR